MADTEALGRSLAEELVPDGTLLLFGDLGSGKTVLTRGLASGLGIDPDDVQSPTFTIIREHSTPSNVLIHIDLYRLTPEEAEGLALEEVLAGPGVKVVEWAERLSFPVANARSVELRRGEGETERYFEEETIGGT